MRTAADTPGTAEPRLIAAGAGTLTDDGTEIELHPGRYVHVPPDASRKPRAGPDGVTLIVIGAPEGRAYTPGKF